MYIVKFNNRTESACTKLVNLAITYAEEIVRNIRLADQAIIYKIRENGTLKPITHVDKF